MSRPSMLACAVLLGLAGIDAIGAAQPRVFQPKVDYPVWLRPHNLVSADFDNDGDIDLATACWFAFGSDGKGVVAVLSNNSRGKFGVTDTVVIGDAVTLAAADIDGNGSVDLVGTDMYANKVYLLLNDGNGNFAVASRFTSGGLGPYWLCTADLDNDGDLDLAVPNTASGNLSVLLNNGDSTFAAPVLYTLGTFPLCAVAGDLDRDGDLDLVVTNNGSGSVSVLLNSGNGSFSPGATYPTRFYPYAASLADFDRDGTLDLAVPNAGSSPFLSLYKGNGDGTFQPRVDWPGCRPHTAVPADYDRDGNLDIAVANNECNSVSVFYGNGNLTFDPHVQYGVGMGAAGTVAADFDRDGDIDLAVANFDNDGKPDSTISVLMNNYVSQGISVLDTIYTPPGYVGGPLMATIFIPDPHVARGIGVVLGRWSDANRLTAKVWCDTLAARGYVAMTIDYPNLEASHYPQPQRDFKMAVEFLRRNKSRFGITTGKIAGFGQSQGSLIWGQTMIWDNDDAFFGTDPAINDRLDAAVLLYGAYDMWNYLLPVQNTILAAHFSQDPSLRSTKGQCIVNTGNITTPVLLIHGTNDQIVRVEHSRMLRDSLLAHGKAVKLFEIGGAGHGFDMVADGPLTSLGLVAKDAVLSFLSLELSDIVVAPAKDTIDRNRDSVRVMVRVADPAGLAFSVQIESPDEIPVDTLILHDDGAHGDSAASDGIFANFWIPGSKSAYYLDVISTLHDTLALVEWNNVKVYIVSSVTAQEFSDPRLFSLAQNYPNPFNPTTTIEYALPHPVYVSLKVYNLLGEAVATLDEGVRFVGTYKATWDATGMPSGVYFYRLRAGDYLATKKLVLLR